MALYSPFKLLVLVCALFQSAAGHQPKESCCSGCTCSHKHVKVKQPKESCMSGNTGTFKVESSTTEKRTVAIVKELAVGDVIEGLDADKQPALCTVEAIGQFGHGALYGN